MEALLAEENRPVASVILSHPIEDTSMVEYLHGRSIDISLPATGTRRELLDFTERQVVEAAYRRRMASLVDHTLSRATMASIMTRLGYDTPAKGEIVFECYDISHTAGMYTVASRSVLVNGRPAPDRYRKYRVKTLREGDIDDFASIREVLMRRTREAITTGGNFPNLIIIDGGKGQLSSAREAIDTVYGLAESEGVASVPPRPPLASLAKREEEVFIP